MMIRQARGAPMMEIDVLFALLSGNLTAYAQRAFYELRPGVQFHYGIYIRALCHQLERVERGEIKRLLILLPPRHLKSHCASVCFPVWALGRNPSRRIITISYGASLAEEFSVASRRLMMTDWNRAVFPALVIDQKKASAQQLLTTQNGGRIATSVGGTLTGKGGDILIIDDPSKAEDVASETPREKLWEWYTGTAMTRLDNPKTGAIIVVAQRLHEDDLPGRLIATGQYEVLELPAIEVRDRRIALPDGRTWTRPKGDILLPDHMDQENLEAKRQEIGSAKFEAQFQLAPVPAGGNIIKPEWFGAAPSALCRGDYEAVIQSWDPAFVPGESNDYSVCTTWGLIGNYIDLLDVNRAQYLQPDLLRVAAKLREKWKPHLLIVEAVGAGRGVYDHLHQQDRIGIRPYKPLSGKVERMSLQSPKLESGQVRLRQAAPWCPGFLSEAAAFPNGKYDDQIDSMSQALYALDRRLSELRHCSRFKG